MTIYTATEVSSEGSNGDELPWNVITALIVIFSIVCIAICVIAVIKEKQKIRDEQEERLRKEQNDDMTTTGTTTTATQQSDGTGIADLENGGQNGQNGGQTQSHNGNIPSDTGGLIINDAMANDMKQSQQQNGNNDLISPPSVDAVV